jgi:stearoyl-CoA desaturase (delta-9 desaturase)
MKKLNWKNTLFLTITPLVAVVGTIYLALHHAIYWQTLVLALVFIFLTGLSITAGYHRLFSHLSYKTHPLVRLFYLLFGAAAFEGSVLEWSTDHRNHHRYTDTDQDPYDIKKGFWFAHMGWLFFLDPDDRDYSNVEDLSADPLIRWQHRHFIALGFLICFLLPTLIATIWGDPLGGFIIAGALRVTLNQQFTFCINSVCHLWGKRSYSEGQSARDNWVTALFTYGEGFHNFHHQFPIDYRNGIRFFHYDPTKWLIRLLAFCGLASDLKQVGVTKICQYQMRVDENRLKIVNASEAFAEYLKHSIDPLRERLVQLFAQIEDLEKNYRELKQHGLDSVRDKVVEQRKKLLDARLELKRGMSKWARLVRMAVQHKA